MEKQLLSGTGKRVLISLLTCYLWSFAIPASARAADPAFGTSTCYVQSVTGGGMTFWQIKGTTSVTGLNPGSNPVSVTIKFQKKASGAPNWTDLSTVTQSTNGVNGYGDY